MRSHLLFINAHDTVFWCWFCKVKIELPGQADVTSQAPALFVIPRLLWSVHQTLGERRQFHGPKHTEVWQEELLSSFLRTQSLTVCPGLPVYKRRVPVLVSWGDLADGMSETQTLNIKHHAPWEAKIFTSASPGKLLKNTQVQIPPQIFCIIISENSFSLSPFLNIH